MVVAMGVFHSVRRRLAVIVLGSVVAGKGEADPAVPNDSEANRRINRRVVISYLGR